MQNQYTVCLALLIALVPNCLLAQPFFFRKDIPLGEKPHTIVVGDFNGDGRPDLAVSTWEGLVVLLNEGRGNFGRPILSEITVQGLSTVGDFDRDGRDDLMSLEGILLSRGEGTFLAAPAIRSLISQSGAPIAAADFNGDEWLDLLTGDDELFRVWLAKNDGSFEPGAMLRAGGSDDPGLTLIDLRVRQALVADFNGDGRSDVAMVPMSIALRPHRIFLGQGDGTFGPEIPTWIDLDFHFGLASANHQMAYDALFMRV